MSGLMKGAAALGFLSLLMCSLGSATAQDVHVDGYYRSDGTYVQPHYRSRPDGNPYNNFSSPGNVNPYTGATSGDYAPRSAPRSDYRSYEGSSGGYGTPLLLGPPRQPLGR